MGLQNCSVFNTMSLLRVVTFRPLVPQPPLDAPCLVPLGDLATDDRATWPAGGICEGLGFRVLGLFGAKGLGFRVMFLFGIRVSVFGFCFCFGLGFLFSGLSEALNH